MRLLSSEAKDWKSRVVSEAEQVLVKESAEAAHRTTEVQEAMDKQFQVRWRQAEADLWDMCDSNSAQVQILAASLRKSELQWNTTSYILPLEAQALRRSQDLEQEALSIAHQCEVEVQQLQDKTDAQPQSLKEQWKQQMSQTATHKAEIHALHTELANMAEKSELQATLSAKMCSVGNLLNTPGPWALQLTFVDRTQSIDDTEKANDRRRAESNWSTCRIWPRPSTSALQNGFNCCTCSECWSAIRRSSRSTARPTCFCMGSS